MNKSNNDEYSEMVKLFNQLTVEEAELVLIFIRNLRQNRKNDETCRKHRRFSLHYVRDRRRSARSGKQSYQKVRAEVQYFVERRQTISFHQD